VELLEFEKREIPLSVQADLLGLNRCSLYYKPVGPSEEEVRLKHRIDEVYTACPFYGSRKITASLKLAGYNLNRKAVIRHMREMGLRAIYPGPNLSKRDLQHRIYPYLLRGLNIKRPDQVWGIDITYIRLRSSWMYLVAIIDWYSRYVVDWELEQSLEIGFVLETVTRVLSSGKPEIFNSDQGSHFTSPKYIEILKNADILISMDGKGRAIDNIFTERFWRSLKYEDVYLKDYSTPREARVGIRDYMSFYNNERPHQSLGYRTPASFYRTGTGCSSE
jgi:putative transposase